MSHRSSAENLLLISCSNPNISLYGFSVNFSEIELHRLSWIFSSWWIYFCCCSRFSVEQSVLPRLLYKYTGTNLEGYRFLCQVQIHRHQNCLLKKKKQIEVSTEWHFLSCIIAWRSWFFKLKISIFSCLYTPGIYWNYILYWSSPCNEKSCNKVEGRPWSITLFAR